MSQSICSEFNELHGDRMYADDLAIVGGLGRIDERAVMIIGHQKGRDTKERVRRNYGMPKPEGYRKALRLMRLAERFSLPLVTLIDTQGAYPGVGAEERGQSEAIARNLFEMSVLQRAHRHGRDRRGRLGRRAGHRGVRPLADAPVQHLLGDLTGRLRLDPVEEPGQEGSRGRGAESHRRSAEASSGWWTRSSRSRWAARTATHREWRAAQGRHHPHLDRARSHPAR